MGVVERGGERRKGGGGSVGVSSFGVYDDACVQGNASGKGEEKGRREGTRLSNRSEAWPQTAFTRARCTYQHTFDPCYQSILPRTNTLPGTVLGMSKSCAPRSIRSNRLHT